MNKLCILVLLVVFIQSTAALGMLYPENGATLNVTCLKKYLDQGKGLVQMLQAFEVYSQKGTFNVDQNIRIQNSKLAGVKINGIFSMCGLKTPIEQFSDFISKQSLDNFETIWLGGFINPEPGCSFTLM